MTTKCYFCRMYRTLFLFFVLLVSTASFSYGQSFVKTTDIFKKSADKTTGGHLNINQNYAIDTLISRYILANVNLSKLNNGNFGMAGFRIQIYSSSNRNAREESNKADADFISKFPDIISYPLYAEPGYFKIRVGDFRTKTEAMKLFLTISKVFPDSYIVPDIINFPSQNKK
jgi:hypothetical protein